LRSRIVNFIIGARYDNNSGYPSAFSPRIGLTKKIDKFDFKLLYSQGFRSPGIEDIDLSAYGKLVPEITQVLELQAGWEITSDMYLTANVYNIYMKNPIVYVVDTLNYTEGYENLKDEGTRGFEVDYRIKSIWGYAAFNYSFYTAGGSDVVAAYSVPDVSTATLGFAQNKFNLYGCYNVTRNLSIAPTISFIGKRYGYAYLDSTKYFAPTVLANLFVSYNNCFTKGLNIGIGCYNIFNSDYAFLQPYNSGHPPLPSQSREIALRIKYNFSFAKKDTDKNE